MGTAIVAVIVLGAVALAIRSMVREKKNGKACGTSCNQCRRGCGH